MANGHPFEGERERAREEAMKILEINYRGGPALAELVVQVLSMYFEVVLKVS